MCKIVYDKRVKIVFTTKYCSNLLNMGTKLNQVLMYVRTWYLYHVQIVKSYVEILGKLSVFTGS